MRHLSALIKRNVKLYFSDRVSVFFSLLGAIIVLFLVGVFLKDNIIDSIVAAAPTIFTRDFAEAILSTWLVPSASVIAAFTVGLGAMGQFVDDRETGRWRDFVVTPLPRWVLTLGYLVSAVIISVIVTIVVYLLGIFVYCLPAADAVITLSGVLVTGGWLLLSCIAFTALATFIVSFVKTQASFAAISTVVGVLTGFINGTYVIPGTLSTTVNNVLSSLPFAQAASLVRASLMADTLSSLPQEAVDVLKQEMGIALNVGSYTIDQWVIVVVLITMAVVFSLASWARISRRVTL